MPQGERLAICKSWLKGKIPATLSQGATSLSQGVSDLYYDVRGELEDLTPEEKRFAKALRGLEKLINNHKQYPDEDAHARAIQKFISGEGNFNRDLYATVLKSETLTSECKAKVLFCEHGDRALSWCSNAVYISIELFRELRGLQSASDNAVISDKAWFVAMLGLMENFEKKTSSIQISELEQCLHDTLLSSSEAILHCWTTCKEGCGYLGQVFLEGAIRSLKKIKSGNADNGCRAWYAQVLLRLIFLAKEKAADGKLPLILGRLYRRGEVTDRKFYLTNHDLDNISAALEAAQGELANIKIKNEAARDSLDQCFEEVDKIRSALEIKAIQVLETLIGCFDKDTDVGRCAEAIKNHIAEAVGGIGADGKFKSEADGLLNGSLYALVLKSDKLTIECKTKVLFCAHGYVALLCDGNVKHVDIASCRALHGLQRGHEREILLKSETINEVWLTLMLELINKFRREPESIQTGDLEKCLSDIVLSNKCILDSSILYEGEYIYPGRALLSQITESLKAIGPNSVDNDRNAHDANAFIRLLGIAQEKAIKGNLPVLAKDAGTIPQYLTLGDCKKIKAELKDARIKVETSKNQEAASAQMLMTVSAQGLSRYT